MSKDIDIRLSSSTWTKVMEDSEDKAILKNLLGDEVTKGSPSKMSLTKMIEFAKKRKSGDKACFRLNRMLQGAELLFPQVETPARNPELEARLARLQAQQNQREYNKMVKNVTHKEPATTGGYRAPVASGLGFAVTVFASIIGALFVLSELVPNVLVRCAIGFVVGIVLMCIEIFLATRAIIREEQLNAKFK